MVAAAASAGWLFGLSFVNSVYVGGWKTWTVVAVRALSKRELFLSRCSLCRGACACVCLCVSDRLLVLMCIMLPFLAYKFYVANAALQYVGSCSLVHVVLLLTRPCVCVRVLCNHASLQHNRFATPKPPCRCGCVGMRVHDLIFPCASQETRVGA